METDSNYEYEAPKWFDFTADFESEINDNTSLDDSWFEREHPLHEPNNPSIHDATAKPLLAGNQGTSNTESSGVKVQSKRPAKKIYNSKKSLGIKTIRTRRGQHENQRDKESIGTKKRNGKSYTATQNDRQMSLRGGKDSNDGVEKDGGRDTPDEITNYKHCSLTPPWTNSPASKIEEVPHERNSEGSNSSLNDAAVFSPHREPVNHSPMSPAGVQTRKVLSSSESPSSPKSSLLSKAVNGACQQGPRKRRLLPSIPDAKNKPNKAVIISSSPSECFNQSADGYDKKAANVCHSMKLEKVSLEEATSGDRIKPLRGTDKLMNLGAPSQAQSQHGGDFCREENKVFAQRSLHAIPENHSIKGTECEKQRSSRCETGVVPNDKSLEELLKMHNKKIVSARSQYDENGRKIRTAEPSFCPAPAYKTSSSLSSSAAGKRPAPAVDKPKVSAKQKRRSCVASVGSVQSEITKPNAGPVSSNLRSNVNKKGKESLNQQTAKQKRRSCMASLQNSGQTNTVDRELRDLIAQHNSRVNAKRP